MVFSLACTNNDMEQQPVIGMDTSINRTEFLAKMPPEFELVEKLIASKKYEASLVGGAVRDWLMGRPSKDLDICVPERSLSLARQIADELKGAYYPLDEEREAGRVVLKHGGQRIFIDVTRYRGSHLEEDIRRRDFTVNAIAIKIGVKDFTLFDPSGGAADIERNVVCEVTENSIADDPIRSLRGVRFAVDLGFSIDKATGEHIKLYGKKLGQCSAERIRDEWLKLLALPGAAQAVVMARRFGLLEQVLPEIDADYFSQIDAAKTSNSLPRLRGLPQILAERLPELIDRYGVEFQSYLDEELDGDVRRSTMMAFAALLADIDEGRFKSRLEKPSQIALLIPVICRRLRMSGEAAMFLGKIVSSQPYCVQRLRQAALTRKDIYRFFNVAGDAGIAALLVACAAILENDSAGSGTAVRDQLAASAGSMMDAYFFHHQEMIKPAPLLDGAMIMAEFGLKPGRQIGRLLEILKEAQASGEVRTEMEARELLSAEIYSQQN